MGADPGGGEQDPHYHHHLLVTTLLHTEEKSIASTCANVPRFSTEQLRGYIPHFPKFWILPKEDYGNLSL